MKAATPNKENKPGNSGPVYSVSSRDISLELVDHIPPDARSIIEFGCTSELLVRQYKQRNPLVFYLGVTTSFFETSSDPDGFDKLLLFDGAQSLGYAKEINWKMVDAVIIHGDAIRNNLIESEFRQLLEILSGSITDNCVAIVEFSNDGYWPNLKNQLTDNSLNAAGIDKIIGGGQFTYKNIHNFFTQSGFHVLNVLGIGSSGPDLEQFINEAREIFGINHIEEKAFNKACGYKKFIVSAVTSIPTKRLLLQTMTLKPVAACNDIRVYEPHSFLRTIPGVRTSTSVLSANITTEKYNEAKVFIWQRPIMTRPKSVSLLKSFIKSGYLVIVEFDDDPRRWPAIVEHDYLTFRGVHAVQTSTPELAKFLGKFNKNIKVFPNCVKELNKREEKSDMNKIVLFFGALNRTDDWQSLMPVINRILKDYPERVFVNVIHDQEFFNALVTSNKSFKSLCNYSQYLDILNQSDIGLLPLLPTDFNQYKSDLKFIEHAANGVVALASPTVYAKSITDNKTGMIFHDEHEFEKKLRLLIEDDTGRRKIADNARQWIKDNRLLSSHYRERYEWYMELLKKLPQLNLELKQNMPELF